jgi:hypothetical protein
MFGLAAIPAVAGPGVEVWKELLTSRPQKTGVSVAGVVLVRDAFIFHLDSGAFFPLTEVSGHVVGGIFKGQGRFELKPATEAERSFLARRLKKAQLQVLTDTFEEAVFLFTDGSVKELLPLPPSVPTDLDKLASIYDEALQKSERGLYGDLRMRLVPDLVEIVPPARGIFLAYFRGHELPPALAIFSPRGLARTWFEPASGPETTALAVFHKENGGFWYSERPLNTAQASAPDPSGADLIALHYTVETTIQKSADIEGRTVLRLRAARDGVRVVPFDLFPKLRLSSVRLTNEGEAAVDLPFIQGDEESAGPVLAILWQPLALGEEVELTAEYKGDGVLRDAGSTSFYVSARGSWYPTLTGSQYWAVYDLEYRIPKDIARRSARRDSVNIVSVGRFIDSGEIGDFAVYRFTTDKPVPGAGFNYGLFRLIERDDPESGVKIRVYPNPVAPDSFVGFSKLASTSPMDGGVARSAHYAPISMAEDILADSINTARVGTLYFGPLLLNDIAVTEQPEWIFGQSWPTLVYIPYIAFLDWVARSMIGLDLPGIKPFVKEVTPHEFAHQWWGNGVGSATYRDIWLEEGLAEFTVGLVIEKALGEKASFNFWERARKDILDLKAWHAQHPVWGPGPISLGSRLAYGEEGLRAFQSIVYSKGAFVVHMLRSLFADAKNPNHDERFMDTMKDYFKTWAGRNATTADFRAIVERHAPPACGGDLGWFFHEWIEGTAIPKIKAAVRIEDGANGHYMLAGEIKQSDVPQDFRSILPVYLEIENGRFERCAQVSITGNRTLQIRQELSLPKRPLRVLINPNHEWLTR